jgi:glucose-6-phosphate 1-dehydrogenase
MTTSNSNLPSTILVIIGITGDLAKRKLLPALNILASHQTLPNNFQVIGISRYTTSVKQLLVNLPQQGYSSKSIKGWLEKHISMFQMDLSQLKEYIRLADHLKAVTKTYPKPTQVLFYLSVPPQVSQPIVEYLGQAGLGRKKSTKLLLEKPFGTDLISAKDFIAQLNKYFSEAQIYRIDHYLAKEMAQNLIVFRNENSLFKRTWNNTFIEKIELSLLESIGIESRVNFYEQTGALRDVVQGHLLQLTALTLMNLPPRGHWQSVPSCRLQALLQLSLFSPSENTYEVVRGQYQGYRQEVSNNQSFTETFVALKLHSIDPNWHGVPIILTTGKALNESKSEITIHYRKTHEDESDRLILRIQPNEGIEVQLWSKRPGYDRELEKVDLAFSYKENKRELADAYERVLIDAIHSDHSLFTSSAEVEASWQILQPLQNAWGMSDGSDLQIYKPGSHPEKIIPLSLDK